MHHGGLTASGHAQKRYDLAWLCFKRYIAEDGLVAVSERYVLKEHVAPDSGHHRGVWALLHR